MSKTRLRYYTDDILARAPEFAWAVPTKEVFCTELVGPVLMERKLISECAPRKQIRLADMFGKEMYLKFDGQRGYANQIRIYDQERDGNLLFFHNDYRAFGPGDSITFGWIL